MVDAALPQFDVPGDHHRRQQRLILHTQNQGHEIGLEQLPELAQRITHAANIHGRVVHVADEAFVLGQLQPHLRENLRIRHATLHNHSPAAGPDCMARIN